METWTDLIHLHNSIRRKKINDEGGGVSIIKATKSGYKRGKGRILVLIDEGVGEKFSSIVSLMALGGSRVRAGKKAPVLPDKTAGRCFVSKRGNYDGNEDSLLTLS